jgi:hypothetical protein
MPALVRIIHKKSHHALFANNTEAGKFIILTVQKYRGHGRNKGVRKGGRKLQVISWAERGSSSFLDCVVAVCG